MSTRRKTLLAVVLFVYVLSFGGVFALAQTEGEINACVNPSDGTLRIVTDPVCKKNENLLTWNIQGPPGPPADVDALEAEVDALAAEVDTLQAQMDDLLSPPAKTVFISSDTYTGDLGGLAGADAKCQGLADAVGLPGTFKAWLSDSTTSVAARFTHSAGPYMLLDGVKVADNWADLTDGELAANIWWTEKHEAPSDSWVWTGTTAAGDALPMRGTWPLNCEDWTTSQSDRAAWYGYFIESPDWTAASWTRCDYSLTLYCFEQ